MENENEQPEVLSVAVTDVIDKLLERQMALEMEVTTTSRRADALDRKAVALETVCALQQAGLEKLGVIVEGHQRVFEAQAGYLPPSPAMGSRN